MAKPVFGKYEKIRRLAQGGMGDVFLARQTGPVGFDRLVILKSLKDDLAKEETFIEQFLDEARVAATLNHPNIVGIYDVGEWEGAYYIAMEYIAGEDLSRLWYAAAKKGVGLPFQVSVRIVHDACLALDHAHHASDLEGRPLHIVHRDVSPQNIMVRGDGVTKLVDFGIAKAANRVTRTRAGTVKGKLQYMSPEQVRGEPLDGRSDQFSLGVVLWEMCTGKRLFKADSELETLNKILQHPIPAPSSTVGGFPAELEGVILRMLQRDRDKRYRRCADVARDLKAYLDRAQQSGGEVPVADFVESILGDALKARTRDLTPERAEPADNPAPGAEERPRPAPTPPPAPEPAAPLRVKQGDGSLIEFQGPATLHQWILEGQLGEDELLSSDGRAWERLGDKPELAKFFELSRAMKQMTAEVPSPVALGPGATTSSAYGPTVAGWGPAAPPPTVSQPVPRATGSTTGARTSATDGWQLGAMPHGSPTRPTPLDAMSMPFAAPAPVPDDDDEPRRGGLRWLFAGVIAALALAVGGLYAVDRPLFEQILASFVGAPSQPVFDDADLMGTLRRGDRATLEAKLTELLPVIRSSDEARAAHAQASAALVHVELARLLGDEAQRIAAYRLATQARAAAPDDALTRLAMAAYQAERGALVEMRADLAAVRGGLPEGAPLLEEARAIAALGGGTAALAGPAREAVAAALVEVKVALAAGQDRRLAALASRLEARLGGDATEAPRPPEPVARKDPQEPQEPQEPGDAPRSFDELYRAAERARRAGRCGKALSLYQKATALDDGRPRAWSGLGWCSLDLGRNEAAVRSFERAVRLDGRLAEARFGLAEALRFSGDRTAAVRAYRAYLERWPDGEDAAVAKNALQALE